MLLKINRLNSLAARIALAFNLMVLLAAGPAFSAPCDTKSGIPFIRHDLSESYCELCNYGYVTVVVSNPYRYTYDTTFPYTDPPIPGATMTDMEITEDLGSSGLEFYSSIPVTYFVNGSYSGSVSPSLSGSVFTLTDSDIPPLASLAANPSDSQVNYITIRFAVRRTSNPEGLVSASRSIQATLIFDTDSSCTHSPQSDSDILPIREPDPDVFKRGRNVDADQDGWSTTIYGNEFDDVIWRIQVRNDGDADLQDLRFDDLMQTGNINISYICPTAAGAAAVAANNGVDPGGTGCLAAGNSINNFDVDNPFGNPDNDAPDLVDVPAGDSAYIFLVGKVPNSAAGVGSCSVNRTNTVSDVQWGCEAEAPAGGIAATSDGNSPGDATATLSTLSDNDLDIGVDITGVDPGQPAGAKARVRITIANNTGGTVKNIRLRDVLPVEYVMDPTYAPRVAMDSAYGAYPGMTDNITWDNPVAGTYPDQTSNSAADYLGNTSPEFTLTSDGCSVGECGDTVHPIYGDQVNMLRHGDELTITFGVIMIDSSFYDRTANLDVREEAPGAAAQDTDPDNDTPYPAPPHLSTMLANRLEVEFENFCQTGVTITLPAISTTHDTDPEDLDIDITGTELVFILTGDPAQRLPLTVDLTNRGGHDAEDFTVYITFGRTMDVVTVPAGCTLIGNPPPLDEWQSPAQIPPDATIYRYQYNGTTVSEIGPGTTRSLAFEVVKSTDPADIAADDLSFRADVIGEIAFSNPDSQGRNLLWYPIVVNPRTDGGSDRANNYSLDGIRARVVGFNLLKSQLGTCSENNPPVLSQLPPDTRDLDRHVQIGEECSYHIDTGGWFGFQTPGFTYIAVQRIQVVDELPNGQGYVSSTEPLPPTGASTGAITGVSLNPAGLSPVDEGWIDWTFNQVVPAERIDEKDHWFRVDTTARLLNDPIDTISPPNEHAALSTNTLNSYFQAVFFNDTTGMEEVYDLGPSTVGYPRVEVRRVALRVTEPEITVVKEVCNESLYGVGPACSNWVDLAGDGDAYNDYIYRITLTNEAADSGVDRAPAYDVTVTDTLDASDLAYVLPFAADGLDNDGDGGIGAGDTDGEGVISDNVVDNGTPGVITFSYTHSSALQRIDPGASVQLFYRVDYDDDAAPLQTFTNSADSTYDSLEGVSGSQTVDPRMNSDIGGARFYTSPADTASVQIIPVQTQPKRITALSNTLLAGDPQNVSIGEEIEYRLNTLLPVAQLRQFVIRDELPAGLSCSEAPAVNLNAAPYAAAGFDPGGTITPTCTDTHVEWDFGDQRLTNGIPGSRFDFEIEFIARVENTAATNDGDVLSNGNPVTAATTVRYIDEDGNPVVLDFDQVDAQVREPRIDLTKSFAVADTDAADVLTVTVTATNSGTAAAYNLRVLDDLTGLDMTFTGTVGGADPPDSVDTTTLGANRPIFSWSAPNGIDPGNTISFTFNLRVDDGVQPHEVLDNTIQADWTSLPGQTTALNSSGSIGADGSAAGMRNGALPNAGDPVNDYEAAATDDVAVPPVTMTKTDLDPAVIPAIGAHKSFQIDIRLPEGITEGVVVTDSLDAAGISYLLENNAGFDITYTFQGIALINGIAPSETAFNGSPADGTTGSAVWDIGTVATQTENDTAVNAIDPLIRIHYYARVNNDLVTDDGDTLQNSVTTAYANGETGATETLADNTAPAVVVEPVLTAAKTVGNITSPGNPAGGGDVLEYVLTIPNSGTSTAHDVNIVDILPAGLSLDGSFTPLALINGIPAAGFAATPANTPTGPLVWGRHNGDDSLDIPVGQSLVLTYRVIVMELAASFTNNVYVDWTSLDGDNSLERTGAGCGTGITAPNDYCTGPAEATIATDDDNDFDKAITADTYDVAQSTAVDAIARVGDAVTYRLALDMRGGLTRNVVVTDVLPTGMAFVETVSINFDTTADYTPPAGGAGSNFAYGTITSANVPAAGDTGALTWIIGDVDNDPFGDPTTDTLEIVYRARIVPDSGIAHVATTTLDNTATFTYQGGSGLGDTATMTVWQPVINQVTKTDRTGRTSPANVDVATDVMQFRIESVNSGDAPAYSVEVTDQLATQFDESSIANLIVSVGGVILASGVDYTYTAPAIRGGTLHFLLATPVNPGQSLVIDYDIGFYTDFGANQTWNNAVTLDRYWSLPSGSGQEYGPVGPAIFVMHNIASPSVPLVKDLLSPVSAEAAIGEEIVYQITVPANPYAGAMYDVTVTDTLDTNLAYISASETSGNGYTFTDNSTAPIQLRFAIDTIPAGQQAVIEVRARLLNGAGANAGGTISNTAIFTFANAPSGPPTGGGSGAAPDFRIVEPSMILAKSVENLSSPPLNPPRAGDILRYTLTVTADGGAGGDNFSDAFDLRIDDSLSLGLAYDGNPGVDGAGNTIAAPVLSGDGITTAQTLAWSAADGNADIDIPEGSTATITYEVRVLDEVAINQTLTNSATVQWTSLDGDSSDERNGTQAPVWNDYLAGPETTSVVVGDFTAFSKTRLQDTYGSGDADVRIGDIIQYELRLEFQEGSYSDLAVADNLPQGLVFEGIVSVNGDTATPFTAVAPFVHADLNASGVSVAGDPATGPTSLTWPLGDITNPSDGNPANDEFVIVYRARVLNEALVQADNIALTNTASLDYQTASGPAATRTDDETVAVLQPDLTVSKSAAPAGGDTVLAADEIVTYTVDIENSGTAPAYDAVLVDTIPTGMRNGAATVTTNSIELLSGTALPNLAPVYDVATGVATWDFDSGVADQYAIPAGDTLRIVYRVQADSTIGTALTLTNTALVQVYYSLDDEDVPSEGGVIGVREIYGPSNTASVTLTTAGTEPLDKENPAPITAAIGEPFRYTITVPATPLSTSLYDVRILDDLSASAADLTFIRVSKVSGAGSWTPVNTGTLTNLVIEDTATGIDIPAGEQIVIDITARLTDTQPAVSPPPAPNNTGALFSNTAAYTYNQVNGDAGTRQTGGADTTADMTIVGPDMLVMDKEGPANMSVGTPAGFVLDIHNTHTGGAWNLTVMDRLPDDPVNGGTCGAGPSNIVAQFFDDGGAPTSGVLASGTDYTVNFDAATCEWTLQLLSAAGPLRPDDHLVINYDAELDADTVNAATFTNVAGVTQWYGYDPNAPDAAPHLYTYALNDGTPGDDTDQEDAHEVTTQAPIVSFEKSVVNLTTGQDPGTDASPGDVLEYTIRVTNTGPVEFVDFIIEDEVDLLNDPAVFAAGTLSLDTASLPPGADISGTSATGGTHGTGMVSVAGLNLGAAGSGNESLTVVFRVTLADVITSGTMVRNQAVMTYGLIDPFLQSDDPEISGIADPTETLIASAPRFQVQKVSTDMTGDPAVLMAGDTLRYIIIIKNIGSENALNVQLRDFIPASTTYVANSTRLNGNAVPDVGGISPLHAGIAINAPEDTTAGTMRADADPAADNTATVTFDVVVDPAAMDGLIIENQGFVSGDGSGSGTRPDQPSDDPDTPVADDPTRDVVGNLPLLYAHKTVVIAVDNGSTGIVDPGDTLRYTIDVRNSGAIPATNVVLTDAMPTNTTYVPASTQLNGVPQADVVGASPLVSGLTVQSADNPGPGIVSAGQNATVTFEVVVNGGLPTGTIISNQGDLTANELPPGLTDADGLPSNGYQPTIIVVGNAQLLTITKTVAVVGGGPAVAGGQLEYVVRATNIGSLPATNVVFTDDLGPIGPLVIYIAGSGTLNGAAAGVTYAGSVLTADYAATYGDLPAGAAAQLRFRVQIDAAVAMGATITNIGEVRWNNPVQNDTASVSIGVGGTPGSATLNGTVWHDANLDAVYDSGELQLAGWTVQLYSNGALVAMTTTDAGGAYRIGGILPNQGTADQYELRFTALGAGPGSASLGMADSVFTNGPHRISDIVAASGDNLLNLNLPITPNGAVYDSVARTAIAGARLTMLNAGTGVPLPDACFDDPNQQDQITATEGFYKFDLNFSQGACPAGAAYLIEVTQPATGFMATPSQVIPPSSDASTLPYDVMTCPADAIPGAPGTCEVIASPAIPPVSVPPNTAGTTYHLHLLLGDGTVPGQSQIFNNPIPIDPEMDEAAAITKTSSETNVTRGSLVPYTITVTNVFGGPMYDLSIIDRFPAGFKYVAESARLNGVPNEPAINGRRLTWSDIDLQVNEKAVIKMLLVVGSGVSEGEYTNRAVVFSNTISANLSGEATATVQVVPDPDFDCTDVIGKVFDDRNLNGRQDDGETGLPGVRVVTARGLTVTTDLHGRFHITCAVVPDEDRGSNFILKLDERSLPSGYRMTTENPRVQRATRGKMLRFNFGTTIHRVVRIDIADGVFEPGTSELRLQWASKIDQLLVELRKAPSVMRLAYLADMERKGLVKQRLKVLKKSIFKRWKATDGGYPLSIETEVFWRRGAPVHK